MFFVSLGTIGFMFTAFLLPGPTLEIPEPTGEYYVGFTSLTLNDAARDARVLTLDIWYPAQNIEGLEAVPYTEHALNVQLSKHQGIPLWLNQEVPSYAFLEAPVIDGHLPAIIFNHGFASFSKQNVSNFQELASHGYMVISIARAGESLLTRGMSGELLELDTKHPSYQAAINLQKDVRTLAATLSAIYTKQRASATLEAYKQASVSLTQTPYFAPMQPLLENWVQDTALVISYLSHAKEAILQVADAGRIIVMGHSLGGAVALEIAKNPPRGVNGVINLDGPYLNYKNDATAFKVPVLNFLSTDFIMAKQDIGLYGTLNMLFREDSKGAHIVEIAGAAHNNFTDLNFTPVLKYFTPLLGKVDNTKMADYLNGAILEFIGRIETGEPLEQPLLPVDEGIKQEFIRG